MGILWNKHSWKQILWPENTAQISYEHKKQHIIGVGNLDIPGYQHSPPQNCPLGGQSWGGESWGYSTDDGHDADNDDDDNDV